MSIASDQWEALETSRKEVHELTGEGGRLRFETLGADNAPKRLCEVARAFEFGERTFDGNQLPGDAAFELRIAESEIRVSNFKSLSSVRQETRIGLVRYTVIGPSPIPPSGTNCFWRIWLTPAEPIQ